jgi:hypothetical protein
MSGYANSRPRLLRAPKIALIFLLEFSLFALFALQLIGPWGGVEFPPGRFGRRECNGLLQFLIFL